MSRFFVLVRPALVPGFQLAGIEAFGAADGESAAQQLRRWLDEGERGLVGIDDGLLAEIDPTLQRRLRDVDHLLSIPIPGGDPLESAGARQERLTRLVRQAVGMQIAFGDNIDQPAETS